MVLQALAPRSASTCWRLLADDTPIALTAEQLFGFAVQQARQQGMPVLNRHVSSAIPVGVIMLPAPEPLLLSTQARKIRFDALH